MPFLKIEYIRLSYIRLLYYMENRNIVHRRIKEYCTSLKSGILYITENRSIVHHWNQEYCTSLKKRNFVQHRKQEFCTTQKSGILYITDILRSVNGPCVVHDLNVEHAAAGSWASVLYLASAGRWSVADLCYWKGERLSHILLWCNFKRSNFLPQLCILHFVAPALYITYFMSDSDLIKIFPKVRCCIATYLLSTTTSADGRCHWQCILKKNVWLGGLWG